MLRLAIKMLDGDRGKYALLISGLTFSTMLMAQAMCLFCGIMSWTFPNTPGACPQFALSLKRVFKGRLAMAGSI